MDRAVLLVGLLLASCGGEGAGGKVATLTVWFHTGKPAEKETLEAQVAAFDAAHEDIAVDLVLIPEDGYHTQVEAEAAGGSLPDVLDFDGPYLANYAWKGYLRPLDDLLPRGLELLPSIRAQGTWAGRLYGVGTFDSGLGLYADRDALARAGVRVPEGAADAWTVEEFEATLAALAEHDDDGRVLDLKLNYTGEWFTYAFSPLLVSAGTDLVSRAEKTRAAGVLDSEAAAAVLERIGGWLDRVDENVDDRAFVDGRVALSWSGHWDFPRYRKALGPRLAVLPLPDFGRGTRTGQGSWAWGVTRGCDHPEAAARFLRFLLETGQVLAMTKANGAVPATPGAIERSPLYGERGPLRLFADQLRTCAVPRPITPAYPVITDAFQRVFAAVLERRPARPALNKAARAIDRDIADNEGYPQR